MKVGGVRIPVRDVSTPPWRPPKRRNPHPPVADPRQDIALAKAQAHERIRRETTPITLVLVKVMSWGDLPYYVVVSHDLWTRRFLVDMPMGVDFSMVGLYETLGGLAHGSEAQAAKPAQKSRTEQRRKSGRKSGRKSLKRGGA